jgi:hypothetical protein
MQSFYDLPLLNPFYAYENVSYMFLGTGGTFLGAEVTRA